MKSISERRARTWVGLKGLAAVTALSTIGLFVACLEATQIDAEMTSDTSLCASPGGARARYLVRVRRIHVDADPQDVRQSDGELDRCDATQASAYLGNFTLLPEKADSREHTQQIQVMLHTAGGDPAECDDVLPDGTRRASIPLQCVVVRRRVKFVEHRGLRVPMYLDDRCRGVTCEEDATCFRGTCASASAECADGVCIPAHERRIAPGGVGVDPTKQANLPPGAVAFDDAGNVILSDGAVVLRDGADVPDVSFVDALTPEPDASLAADGSEGADASDDATTVSDASASTDGGPVDGGVQPAESGVADASVVK